MDIWNVKDDKDPDLQSLGAMVDTGDAFTLPWHAEHVPLLMAFNSRDIKSLDGPLKRYSAFDLGSAASHAVIPDGLGGTCSFKEHMSTSSSTNTDHLSVNVGVTVGYPFLNVGAEVEYDKTVTSNANGVNSSRTSSARLGRVVLDQPPHFSPLARSLLAQEDGKTKFHDKYGDFYVCGYELGAHASACVFMTSTAGEETSKLKVAVTAKVLFWEAKAEVAEKFSSNESFSAKVTLVSYNTIVPTARARPATQRQVNSLPELFTMKASVDNVLDEVASLETNARILMQKHGIEDGRALGVDNCARLCLSGLVTGLLMAPYADSEAYMELVNSAKLSAEAEGRWSGHRKVLEGR